MVSYERYKGDEKELTKHKHELFAKFKIKKLGLFVLATGEQRRIAT